MADTYKILLWTDLETTGSHLDQGDEILEIGLIATDLELNVIGQTLNCVVRPSQEGYNRLKANDFVFKMHTDNGLIHDFLDYGLYIDEADYEVGLWMAEEFPDVAAGEFLMAGSGVSHFDRWFVRKHMPKLESMLHYATLDIGVLRRALRLLAGPSWVPDLPDSHGPSKAHRALADATAHLAEARAYRELFATLP